MDWVAIVPLKGGPDRKSRLAPRLSPEERHALSDRMARHVTGVLHGVSGIARVLLLSPSAQDGPGAWRPDGGRGLNAELEAARTDLSGAPLLVIHGDLPLVDASDIGALLEAAGTSGVAIAPDRHGTGTNAVALAGGGPFAFAFGEGSFARHLAAAGDGAAVVRRPRLSLDIDSPDDLDAARAYGFVWPDAQRTGRGGA